jgi:hypothetical protein
MLDDSDLGDIAEDVVEVIIEEGGWVVVLGFAILLAVFLVVCNNQADCAKTRCQAGATAQLTQHACRCVEK